MKRHRPTPPSPLAAHRCPQHSALDRQMSPLGWHEYARWHTPPRHSEEQHSPLPPQLSPSTLHVPPGTAWQVPLQRPEQQSVAVAHVWPVAVHCCAAQVPFAQRLEQHSLGDEHATPVCEQNIGARHRPATHVPFEQQVELGSQACPAGVHTPPSDNVLPPPVPPAVLPPATFPPAALPPATFPPAALPPVPPAALPPAADPPSLSGGVTPHWQAAVNARTAQQSARRIKASSGEEPEAYFRGTSPVSLPTRGEALMDRRVRQGTSAPPPAPSPCARA